MSLGNRKVVRVNHNFRNKKGMHHYPLVHLCQETEVCTMTRIRRTTRLDQPNPKVVWHKVVVGLLLVVGVLETMMISVVMASRIASSVTKRDTT